MGKNITTQLIAHVDSEIARKFQDMLVGHGQKQRIVMETLIKVWLALPVEIQAKLQANTTKDYYSTLIDELVLSEILREIGNIEPSRRRLLALLRPKGKPTSPKK